MSLVKNEFSISARVPHGYNPLEERIQGAIAEALVTLRNKGGAKTLKHKGEEGKTETF